MEGMPLEDRQLADDAQQGDIAAYETLVRRYQDVAFRTAYVVLRNAAEAEDAAQEGFVKAFYALDRFRPGAPFRPWLLQIVANEARNRKRSAGRRYFLVERASRQTNPATEVAPSPEQAALAGEQEVEINRALERMSEMDRLVITYRYFFDLSEVEMAEALDIPRGTVKSRLSRALGRLREQLTTCDVENADRG